MGPIEKLRYLREFNQARRAARRAHPDWSEEECCQAAIQELKMRYGATPDWQSIIKMILEFIMTLLPFFFLAAEDQ